MSRRPSIRLLLLLAVAAMMTVPTIGCGGGSGGQAGSPANESLFVTYFNLNARTDVYRNGMLELRFSAPVKKNSLSTRTFRVLTGPALATPVEGALIRGGTYGTPGDSRTVYFDPSRSQAQVDRYGTDTPLDTIKRDRPFGFESLAFHQIFLPAPPEGKKTLQNRAGKPIVQQYYATFTTSDNYVPETAQPTFVGMNGSGLLGFIPEPADDGSVAYNAQIVLEFDEPISPASMNPGVTVEVKNEDVLDYLGRPIDIPGTLVSSNDGLRYNFVPSFHYGTGPYRISVTLSFDVKDLAGNPLANPQTLFFTTQFEPEVDTISNITEEFTSNRYEDRSPSIQDRAEWNSVTPGKLVGGEITTQEVTVHKEGDNTTTRNLLVDFPLVSSLTSSACPQAWLAGCRVMVSYKPADLGNVVGAVTKIYWGPEFNANSGHPGLFAATHENIKIRVGHVTTAGAQLGKKFDDNWATGSAPLPSYDGEYAIPNDANINAPPGVYTDITDHYQWPTLTSPFDYNGIDGLLIDFQMDPAKDCQTMRVWFHGSAWLADYPGTRCLLGVSKEAESSNFPDNLYPDGYPMIYDSAFIFRRMTTNAQSQFYDTAQPMPNFGDQIISPPVQAGGASYTLEFQGAHGMPHATMPWRVVPDPSSYTQWAPSIDVADFHRFIRFRIQLIANLNSETVASFDKVQMPFSFRPQ